MLAVGKHSWSSFKMAVSSWQVNPSFLGGGLGVSISIFLGVSPFVLPCDLLLAIREWDLVVLLTNFLLVITCPYYVCVLRWHGKHIPVEVRGLCTRASSPQLLLPPVIFRSNSGCQVWWPASLATEPSCRSLKFRFLFIFLEFCIWELLTSFPPFFSLSNSSHVSSTIFKFMTYVFIHLFYVCITCIHITCVHTCTYITYDTTL